MEKVYKYKHLYFGVLAAMNLLPTEDDATTLYEIEDDALDDDTITPQNADRYPALEVFRCLHAAEGDTLKAKLQQLQQGRANGDIGNGGCVETQDIATQGQHVNPHIGRVLNVEVEVAENVWVKGAPEAIEQVTRMSAPGYPLSLETAKGTYAMDQGEKQIWFIGDKARVSYLTLRRPALPETMDDLIEMLKQQIQAFDEDASAIVDMTCSMLLPIAGTKDGAGNVRMARAMQRLGLSAGTMLPDAQTKINAKTGSD